MTNRTAIYDDIERSTGSANPYADEVVGRLHSGYLNGRNPVSLDQWRFTSDDPEVIDTLAALYGGAPQEIEDSHGDPLHELFSEAESIDVIIEDSDSVSSEFVLWGKDGKVAMRGDGLTIDNGANPDPGASLDLATRKERAKQGLVPSPEVTIFFRLADNPDLGIFKFIKRDAWSFERDLVRNSFYDELDDAEGPIKATLTRVPVSFVAKQGPRAGKPVSYTTTELKYKGAAK